jgi:transposase
MTQGRVEVITSVERRRRWSAAEKRQLVAASLEFGASVSAIAREVGIHPGQLYGWRRQLWAQPQLGFAP